MNGHVCIRLKQIKLIKKVIKPLVDLCTLSNQKYQRVLIKKMVTYSLIITRSGKIIKENIKEGKL